MNLKTIVAIAPFINAILYGLYYALLERNYQKLPMSTVALVSALTSLVLLLFLTGTKLVPLDMSFLKDKQSVMLVIAAQIVSIGVTVMMYLAIRYASATYLAFGELGYPFFVAIFAYLLFGTKELNWHIAAGGIFIVVGCSILLYGRTRI